MIGSTIGLIAQYRVNGESSTPSSAEQPDVHGLARKRLSRVGTSVATTAGGDSTNRGH